MGYYIRLIKPNEIPELCNLIYQIYGDTYVHKNMYDRKNMEILNKSKRLISFVAIGDKEEVIAHVGLKIHGPQGEMSAAFVKKEYRRQNILYDLSEQVVQYGKQLGLEAIYVMSITSHIYSQKVALKLGFKDCALLISCMEPMNFKGIIEKTVRESLKVTYIFYNKPDCLELYIPSSLLRVLNLIYTNLRINVIPMPESEESIWEKSNINIVYTDASICYIDIKRLGKDLLEELDKVINQYDNDYISSIYLYIRLEDSLVHKFYEEFTRRDFFFAGIMPGKKNNILILQKVKEIHPDSIKINSSIGNKIFRYILESKKHITLANENKKHRYPKVI
ncbi:GNAT family N-acetyltransferase [Vallitalea sp.]|jgi:serine/threonine-protein kinase RsbW|uniref:GNAT family N-acetyltransferase n=1 Tax=Vallitalea sp. TaxID=1882829 RepID=UPI0025D340A6|nr:GNAT family N-acetyltransferase [Vallitalea sp.]MCT4687715.1 GNAT family N-acetyltransferase [Vallitalea sp.]